MQWTLLFFLLEFFFNYEDGVNVPSFQVSEGNFLFQAGHLTNKSTLLVLKVPQGTFFLWLDTASQQVDCLEV